MALPPYTGSPFFPSLIFKIIKGKLSPGSAPLRYYKNYIPKTTKKGDCPQPPPRFPPISHRFPPRLPVKLPVLNRFFASRKHRLPPICLALRPRFFTRFRASPALEKTVLPTIPRGRSPPTSPRFSRVVCGFEIVGHRSGVSKVVGSPPRADLCFI